VHQGHCPLGISWPGTPVNRLRAPPRLWHGVIVLDEQTFEGYWWLPATPEQRVRGVLRFRRESFSLRIFGRLIRPPDPVLGPVAVSPEFIELACVWGTTDQGRDITLIAVAGHQLYLPIEMSSPEVWHLDEALIGGHIDETLTVSAVEFEALNLTEWAQPPSIEWAFSEEKTISLSARGGVLDTVAVPTLGTVELRYWPSGKTGPRKADVEIIAGIRITLDEPSSLRLSIRRAAMILDYLTFATDARSPFTKLEVSHSASEDATRLSVLFRSAVFIEGGELADVRPHQMLFDRPNAPNGFDSSLARWVEMTERYSSAWRSLTSYDSHKVKNPDELLLGYTRALEVIHHVQFGEPQLAENERDERISRAIEYLPDDLKDWAIPLLEASSPPRFRHRVLEIVESLNALGTALAGGDPDGFSRRIVSTRNRLTHPEHRRSPNEIPAGADRFRHALAIYWLCLGRLLVAIGFDVASVEAILRRHPETSTLIDQMSARSPTA
jgi:ApeA N-terminal domain 1/Apea-like HEPN